MRLRRANVYTLLASRSEPISSSTARRQKIDDDCRAAARRPFARSGSTRVTNCGLFFHGYGPVASHVCHFSAGGAKLPLRRPDGCHHPSRSIAALGPASASQTPAQPSPQTSMR